MYSKDLAKVASLNREVTILCQKLEVTVAQPEHQARRNKLKEVVTKPIMMLWGKFPSK